MIAALVLAAGAARRYGGGKLLADVGGAPLLSRAIAAVQGEVELVAVVTGSDAPAVEEVVRVAHPAARCVRAERWSEGMGASIAAGIATLHADARVSAAMIVLGDQPLGALVVREMVAAWRKAPAEVMRARYDDGPGHPVILARSQFPALMALGGDEGARSVIAACNRVTEVRAAGNRPPDVDRPGDLRLLTAL
ncbi:MAG: nucleotidyltransferase family protein [Gemmatimonadetes bacterium]|nr:nucleotidyltransferase family protein [Gemmatimonadota bacterium]